MATFNQVRKYLLDVGGVTLPYATNSQVNFTASADSPMKGKTAGEPIIRIRSGKQTNILIYSEDWGHDYSVKGAGGTRLKHIYDSLNPFVDSELLSSGSPRSEAQKCNEAPFTPKMVPENLKADLKDFINNHDFVNLYKQYSWNRDTWKNGFPDILDLEREITQSAKEGSITKRNILAVCSWGKLRNIQKIKCPDAIKIGLYNDGTPNERKRNEPIDPLRQLQNVTKGLGPTYLSKVLRFAFPTEYGAVDTRIVRIFGSGDVNSKKHDWISLKATKGTNGWYIPKNQSNWPRGYFTWVHILRFLAHSLNRSHIRCPHPDAFVRNGLRREWEWVFADVEMALFSYSSANLRWDSRGTGRNI